MDFAELLVHQFPLLKLETSFEVSQAVAVALF